MTPVFFNVSRISLFCLINLPHFKGWAMKPLCDITPVRREQQVGDYCPANCKHDMSFVQQWKFPIKRLSWHVHNQLLSCQQILPYAYLCSSSKLTMLLWLALSVHRHLLVDWRSCHPLHTLPQTSPRLFSWTCLLMHARCHLLTNII